MTKAPRYLVIDGYTREAREQLVSGGASTAADLYCSMLIKCSPPGAECDILFPSDSGASFPSDDRLAGYNGIAWTGCSLCLNDSHMPEVAKQIDLARRAYRASTRVLEAAGRRRLLWSPPVDRFSPIRTAARWASPARSSSRRPVGHIPCTRARRMFSMGSRATTTRSHTFRPARWCSAVMRWTQVQSVAVTHQGGTFWGLQYHPEYDLHEMARLTFCRIPKLVKLGFFRDEAAALEYVEDLENLHADPSRKDIAWRLGIDADIMNEDVRYCEVRNWVQRLVLPHMRDS